MTQITVVGGLYAEKCVWPHWDQVYGSGGRAVVALSGHVDSVSFCTYADPERSAQFQPYAEQYGIELKASPRRQSVSFEYVHSLSVPVIRPHPLMIEKNAAIHVKQECVLRFGMLEGSAVVSANHCVYDPQSAFAPEAFSANGSSADHLAIVANRAEVTALAAHKDPLEAAKQLIAGAEAVVVKSGVDGAYVVTAGKVDRVPPYRTENVWTLGSGDVFAAAFALEWSIHNKSALEAARTASAAVAGYVNSMSLPMNFGGGATPAFQEAKPAGGTIYIAAPFFTMAQLWLVEEARQSLSELGLGVFSPFHDVGRGSASEVAPADIDALKKSDAVLAILDGNDTGTLFEVGHARALNKPVYALAQAVAPQDLKMVEGSGCQVFDDFVTALHHVAWRT